jgi:hypothetical protein
MLIVDNNHGQLPRVKAARIIPEFTNARSKIQAQRIIREVLLNVALLGTKVTPNRLDCPETSMRLPIARGARIRAVQRFCWVQEWRNPKAPWWWGEFHLT